MLLMVVIATEVGIKILTIGFLVLSRNKHSVKFVIMERPYMNCLVLS